MCVCVCVALLNSLEFFIRANDFSSLPGFVSLLPVSESLVGFLATVNISAGFRLCHHFLENNQFDGRQGKVSRL